MGSLSGRESSDSWTHGSGLRWPIRKGRRRATSLNSDGRPAPVRLSILPLFLSWSLCIAVTGRAAGGGYIPPPILPHHALEQDHQEHDQPNAAHTLRHW